MKTYTTFIAEAKINKNIIKEKIKIILLYSSITREWKAYPLKVGKNPINVYHGIKKRGDIVDSDVDWERHKNYPELFKTSLGKSSHIFNTFGVDVKSESKIYTLTINVEKNLLVSPEKIIEVDGLIK